MSDLTDLSLAHMRQSLRGGEFSSRELTMAFIERIERLEPDAARFYHPHSGAGTGAGRAGRPPPGGLAQKSSGALARNARDPAGGEGYLVRSGRALHLRLAYAGELRPSLFRHSSGAPAGCRGDPARQDQHGRVCHGLVHRKFRLWANPQSLGQGSRAGRIQRRQRRGSRRPHGASGAGDRHRRQRAPAGLAVRRYRSETHLRAGISLWPGGLWLIAGCGGGLWRQRSRCSSAVRQHGGSRSERLHLPRSACAGDQPGPAG